MTSRGNDRLSDTFAYHLARETWPPANAYIARLELDATPKAAAATRRALEHHLSELVLDDELQLLKTLACELVDNAVIHHHDGAGARVGLLVGAAPRHLRVEVRDDGPGFERPRSPTPHAGGGGFGLVIVDRAATRWGVASDAGSCVWFEIDRWREPRVRSRRRGYSRGAVS
jgi:anti-sigma regulatory factor (Ser/Thr protein kinase)